MKTKNVLVIAASIALFVGCDNASSNKEGKSNSASESADSTKVEDLHNEVMEIHDEFMPKMDEIRSLEQELDQLAKEKSEKDERDDVEIAELEQIKKQLEMADERMMDWMHNFKKPEGDMPKKEVVRYLEKQKELMEEVGKGMNKAISKADSAVSAAAADTTEAK